MYISIILQEEQSDVATRCSVDSDLVYCKEIRKLMEELQLEHTFQGMEVFH